MNRSGLVASLRDFWRSSGSWLILLAGVAILFLRRPDQFAHPQLWAEDGIFFLQARTLGWNAFLLELTGYHHLAPRLIAALANAFDPAWVPHVFVGGALALTLYVMSRVLSPRCPLPLRPACALALVLAPDAAEVLLNTVNLHWILSLGFIVLLLSRDPVRPIEITHDVIAAIVLGLTGPFSILMTPFFAWRAFARRNRASLTLACLVAACALVQAVTILRHPVPSPPNAIFDPAAAAAFAGLRIGAGSFLGAFAPATPPPIVGAFLTLALLAVVAALAFLRAGLRPLRLVLAGVFVALLASTLVRCWHSMPLLCLPSSASRYVYPPQVLLLWLLLTVAGLRRTAAEETPPPRVLPASLTLAALIAVFWIVAINAPRLRIAPVPDKAWALYAPKLRAGEAVTVPINPDGWDFPFPARPPQ